MKKLITCLTLLMFTCSCAPGLSTYHYEGATTGAAVGAATGAMLDKKNRWRGGVIGAILGSAFGASIADISTRAAQEAYKTGKPVEYRSEDGSTIYRATPEPLDPITKCRKVRETVYENGVLVKDTVKEITKV